MILALSLSGAATAGDHAFIGVGKCKMCHNSPAKGAQYKKWKNSKHSHAYAALALEKAKTIAAEKGLGNPQQADECLKCHVTGHGADAVVLKDKYKVEDGVGCESCHGAGGDYWSMKVMKSREAAVAAGLVIPSEVTCTKCHNSESPTFVEFDFATFSAKIAHPNPKNTAEK